MYMNVHKERTSFFCFGGEERGKKLQRHLTNLLLGQHHPIGICECLDARVLFIFLRSKESLMLQKKKQASTPSSIESDVS